MRIFRAAGSSICNPQAPKISLSFWRGSMARVAALLVLLALAVLPSTASDSPARALVGTAAPLSAITFTQSPASPQPIDTPITLTTTATGGTSVQFQYWVYNANANPAWSQLQGYSATPTCTWTPSTPGNYYLSATALDTSSGIVVNQCAWYTIIPPIVSLTASPASPRAPNTPITLSATATGGTNVQYQFWAYNANLTPTWSQLRGYSASATCAWQPTTPGNYYITMTALDGTSGVASVASYWFTVTGATPLSAVSVSAAPATPEPVNTTITFIAMATGGTNVQCQFWLYNAASSPAWSMLQGYSTQTVCLWAPAVAGDYLLSVTAQDGVTGAIANQMVWYTITPTPLTAVNVTMSPSSPQPASTPITVTASAVGGSNVQYQFWLYNPAASPSWSQLQVYSASPTYQWTPSAAGSYVLSVTAQDIPTGTAVNTLVPYTVTYNQFVGLSANVTTLGVITSGGAPLDGHSPTSAQVTVTVYINGQLANNQAVQFSCTPSLGTIPASTTTNAVGVATVTYQAGAVAGQVSVYATCGALTSQPLIITQQPGPVTAITLSIAPPTATGAAGTVSVKDANGNAVANQTVNLTLTSSNPAIVLDTNPPVVTTNSNGSATFNILNYDQAGTATLTASMLGVVPAMQAVTFTAQPNPQLLNGSLTQNVSPNSMTPLTLQFLEPANTPVWAQVTDPSIGQSQASQANTGSLTSITNPTPAFAIPLTTNASGQVALSYTAASQLESGITVTFYNSAAMQSTNAYGTVLHFNVVLAGPPSVTATPKSSSEIDLSWYAVPNALSYAIRRSPDCLSWTTVIANLAAVANPTYADGTSGTPLQANTIYYYQICATTAIGVSQYSATVNALTFPQAPVITNASAFSSSAIDITWTTVSGALGYRVLYKKSTDTVYTQFGPDINPIPNATSQTLQITGLIANTSYNFEVAAFNASGASNSLAAALSTLQTIPVQKLTALTPSPQIYYSSVLERRRYPGRALPNRHHPYRYGTK